MPHALRTSIGPFSAGTRVNVLQDNHDGTVQIEVLLSKPKGEKTASYDFEDLVFDIEKVELVELRNRVDEVPKMSRKNRRKFLTRLFNKAKAAQ